MARLLLASMLASTAAMNTGDTFTISFHSDADDACAQSLEYEFQMQMYVIQFAVTVMNADNGCLNLQSEYTLNSPGGGQPSSQGGQKYFVGSCVSNTPMSLQYTTEMCDGTASSLYVTGQPLMDTYGDQTSRYTSLFGLVEGQGGSNIGTCQYLSDMSLRPTPNAYYAKMTPPAGYPTTSTGPYLCYGSSRPPPPPPAFPPFPPISPSPNPPPPPPPQLPDDELLNFVHFTNKDYRYMETVVTEVESFTRQITPQLTLIASATGEPFERWNRRRAQKGGDANTCEATPALIRHLLSPTGI